MRKGKVYIFTPCLDIGVFFNPLGTFQITLWQILSYLNLDSLICGLVFFSWIFEDGNAYSHGS